MKAARTEVTPGAEPSLALIRVGGGLSDHPLPTIGIELGRAQHSGSEREVASFLTPLRVTSCSTGWVLCLGIPVNPLYLLYYSQNIHVSPGPPAIPGGRISRGPVLTLAFPPAAFP